MTGWFAIVNPGAGALRQGDFRRRWLPRVRRHVEEMHYTHGPGQTTDIVRQVGTYDGIVIVGGDGTIFEVLAAIKDSDTLLALIPAGRGNCLALDMGVGRLPVAIDTMIHGQPRRIDLLKLDMVFADGRRHSYLAASTVAVGYVADVVALAGKFTPLGRHAYTAAALWSRPRRFPVVADYGAGQHYSGKVTGIVINNTRHLANFRAFPQASLTDGLADVLELRVGWARQLMHNLSVLSHCHVYQPARQFSTPQARIQLPVPDRLMVDGELFADVAEFRVSCRPGAVRVMAKKEAAC